MGCKLELGENTRNWWTSYTNMEKILPVSSNKESLTDFLCDYIKKHGTICSFEHPECGIILAGGLKNGTKVISLTSSGAQEVTNLQCTQEEADTWMTFHAVKDLFSRKIP